MKSLSAIFLLVSSFAFAAFETMDPLYLVGPMRCHAVVESPGLSNKKGHYGLAFELTSVRNAKSPRTPISLEVKMAYLEPQEQPNYDYGFQADSVWYTSPLRRHGSSVYSQSFSNLGGELDLTIVESSIFGDQLIGTWSPKSAHQSTSYKLNCKSKVIKLTEVGIPFR